MSRPQRVEPMLAYASTSQGGRAPMQLKVLDPDEWLFQLKVDGVRAQLMASPDGEVALIGREGNDLTAAFPEIVQAARRAASRMQSSFSLDGEVQLVGQIVGTSTLADLMRRVKTQRAAMSVQLAQHHPARFAAFDLLHDEEPLLRVPLRVRMHHLQELLQVIEEDALTLVPFQREGVAYLAEARRLGLEGIVAKRWDSIYEPGVRGPNWVKFKNLHRIRCLAVSWEPSTSGDRPLKNLVLAVAAGTRPVEVGTVGTGMSQAEMVSLKEQLVAGQYPLVEIECLGISTSGKLRMPVYLHQVPDGDILTASAAQLTELPVTT